MLTDEISDADRERDQLLSGYRAAVKGFRNVSVLAMADAAYRLLVKIVNAMVLLLDESKYAAFIDFVNELIVRYKQQVIPSGKSGKEPEFPPEEESEA